jgi:hypothetical protein
MSQLDHYEMLVLGSGEGGKFLAWHTAKAGHRTAVIERKLIGGSRPNTNCLPSKNEIWSAKIADLVSHAERFGTVRGPVAVDMTRVRARKRDMVEVMAVVQTAMLAGMPYTGMRDAIIAHPTMAEGLGALFSNVPTR